MVNVNFVPDDYIQNNESRRTNIIYLVLFGVVMAGLGGAFTTIKIRQHAVAVKERAINEQMAKASEAIQQFEQLQMKRKEMMKTALTTAALFEPVPRSVLLADVTNNLPSGTSLLNFEVIQKQQKRANRVAQPKQNKFKQGEATIEAVEESPEKHIDTDIKIEGIAPSDLQVAALIENLSCSHLLENVALVESKEDKREQTKFRKFKLTASLRKDVQLSKSDIEYIRTRGEKATHKF